jgi:hypothetical protein
VISHSNWLALERLSRKGNAVVLLTPDDLKGISPGEASEIMLMAFDRELDRRGLANDDAPVIGWSL